MSVIFLFNVRRRCDAISYTRTHIYTHTHEKLQEDIQCVHEFTYSMWNSKRNEDDTIKLYESITSRFFNFSVFILSVSLSLFFFSILFVLIQFAMQKRKEIERKKIEKSTIRICIVHESGSNLSIFPQLLSIDTLITISILWGQFKTHHYSIENEKEKGNDKKNE